MNRLHKETSPYLLQHKDNPVHWYPWCEEAFERAQKENKPVLVSIGYSSCHWCHVMEHESFEKEDIAGLMNELFINIKVDREEYPDVDHFYMDAVQAMTGSGGWPLNVFVTPDKRAFYGGTYFPPQRMHNRASWREVLLNVYQFYSQNQNEVNEQAARLLEHLQTNKVKPLQQEWDKAVDLDDLYKKIRAQADLQEGGFGHAPKFPSTHALHFLMHYAQHAKKEEALEPVFISLDKMAQGGLYDHLAGGFSRYSTDSEWVVPHFEKMLYDNALLLEIYAYGFLLSGKEDYRRVCDETVSWLTSEMMHTDGGFYAAQDADSEGEEGKYYCWHYEELKELAGTDWEQFTAYYHILPEGNWEEKNIIYTRNSLHHYPKTLDSLRAKLLLERKKRIPPLTDTKQILGWNALMARALVLASVYLERPEWLELAETNLNYLWTHFTKPEGGFYHTRTDQVSKITAYADDLAYLADAFVELAKASGNPVYLERVGVLLQELETNYQEEGQVLYNFSHRLYAQTTVSKQDTYDGAVPSVNAILCRVLFYFGTATLHLPYQEKAQNMLQALQPYVQKHPLSFCCWALEFLKQKSKWKDLCITGNQSVVNYNSLIQEMKRNHFVYYISTSSHDQFPCFKTVESSTAFSFCTSLECLPPLDSIEKARVILQED